MNPDPHGPADQARSGGTPPVPPELTPELHTPAHPKKNRAGRDLPAAIAVGVLLVGSLVVSLFVLKWAFVLLVATALALGVVEVYHALQRINMNAAVIPLVAGTIVLVSGSYFAARLDKQIPIPTSTLILGILGAIALTCLVWRMRRGSEGYVRDVAASMFILGYIPLLGTFVGLLLAGDNGSVRVMTFISTVSAGDIGGYVVGILFGRHKMSPRISPKKTWEGLIGSVLFGMLVATGFSVWGLGAPFWVGIILGITLVAVGTCGDLIESLIKRDVGIKDMSSVLPGHGGVMDRLDSLLVAAPVAWVTMFLLVPGG